MKTFAFIVVFCVFQNDSICNDKLFFRYLTINWVWAILEEEEEQEVHVKTLGGASVVPEFCDETSKAS